MKEEVVSPRMGRKEKTKRTVVRRVERPKTVYERFPTFEKDKVLDFTELFKGYTVPRSRTSKRYFTGKSHRKMHLIRLNMCFQSSRPIRSVRNSRGASSKRLWAKVTARPRASEWQRLSLLVTLTRI